jgi:hypothetical protein
MPDKDEVPGSSPGRPTTDHPRSQRCRQPAGHARCQPGPRWGRTPSPPAPRAGGHPDGPPPRPPHTVVAHPARGHQSRGRCGQLAPGACSLPTALAPATGGSARRPACLVAQRAGAAAAARPTPDRVRHRHPTDHRTTSAAPSVPRAPRLATQPPEVAAATGTSTGCCGEGCPAASTWFLRQRRRLEETDATGQRGGQQRAGHRTGGQQGLDAGRVDSNGPDRRAPDDERG